MKTPADGWDDEERRVVEDLREELEALHVETPFEQSDADRLLERIRRDVAREHSAVTGGWSWLRPALAIVAIFAVGLTAWMVLGRAPGPTPVIAPQPEPPIAAAPAPPAFQLPLDKPEVTLSLAAMTWRGSQGNNQLLSELKIPLDAYREGNYAVADREFSRLEARYPDTVEVFFYGGVTRLFLDQPDRALVALTRAGELADATLIDLVNWYRAVAEHREGRMADARNRLQALCRNGRTDAARACRAVEDMDAAAKIPDAR